MPTCQAYKCTNNTVIVYIVTATGLEPRNT